MYIKKLTQKKKKEKKSWLTYNCQEIYANHLCKTVQEHVLNSNAVGQISSPFDKNSRDHKHAEIQKKNGERGREVIVANKNRKSLETAVQQACLKFPRQWLSLPADNRDLFRFRAMSICYLPEGVEETRGTKRSRVNTDRGNLLSKFTRGE